VNAYRWTRRADAYVIVRDGTIIATVYRTGSRLATDRWHWYLPGANVRGSAGALVNAKADAERAIERMPE
jgi:hypothetical protein